ncbi:MAG: lamin tail domain-containing protein [Thermoplasmata archaeon]|nr:lamin tail domain-containing protein [Thermoplasmata archaeon]
MRVIAAATVAILLMASLPISQSDEGKMDIGLRWVKAGQCAGEGEIVKIKARVDNLSNGKVPPFTIYFYHDEIKDGNLIGKRHYDSINVYRIPSVSWDTKGFVGEHKIIAFIDINDGNASNNYCSTSIKIFDTSPGKAEKKMLITEVYYHAYPNRNNEYICIHNPTPKKINIYGWYLTKDPWKRADKQTKIIFPNMFVEGNQTICVTQNASSFFMETGKNADFEYYDCSSTPDLERKGSFILSNEGGVICLKDLYNHTIDTVVYGNKNFSDGWNGKAVKKAGMGEIIKRKFNGTFIDTNSSSDWEQNRTYIIGQSNFSPFHIQIKGNLTLFSSPDCSFSAISSEIEKAHNSIYLNLYEFTNPQLCDAICRALDRNISVTLLLEGQPAGGLSMAERYVASRIDAHGGKVFYMAGDEEEGRYRRYAFDHAKYAIIDNSTAIIQSANWGKTGVPASSTFGNREWGIAVKNKSLAGFLLEVFEKDIKYEDVVPFNSSDFLYGSPSPDFVIDDSVPEGIYDAAFSAEKVNSTCNFTIILSPDNAEDEICKLINSATKSILVEQLYIQKNWNGINPFLKGLVNKSKNGVRVKVIMNYNPSYESTDRMNEETAIYLRNNGIEVKFVYSNWSYFTNVHNKGMVIDGRKTLVSSINWNENSVRNNREVGVIVDNGEVAEYFTKIFNYDWNLSKEEKNMGMDYESYTDTIAIIAVFSIAFFMIYLHWRRK